MASPDERAPNDAELSRYLAALALPNRLALLRKLQMPHALAEIELPAVRPREEFAPDRTLSRQAVHEHLAKLVEVGLVTTRSREREGRATIEYVVNQARLFIVTDELRRLSLIRSVRGASDATAAAARGDGPDVELPRGPALVLAGGPLEGRAFALEGAGPWIVGRDAACDVPLAFDPFVSKHNARVLRERGAWSFEAAADARNPTLVNWRPVPAGARAPIEAGDLVSVGRTLLVVRGV